MEKVSPERIEHALKVLSSMENMRSRNFICDFEVKVENGSFYLHRAILAASSGYFEALFSGNMKESREGSVTMKDVDAPTFKRCIEYMYTGTCKLKMDCVEETLRQVICNSYLHRETTGSSPQS